MKQMKMPHINCYNLLMSELIYFWTIAQLFWVYFLKIKPISVITFLLTHGILFWVLLANHQDLEPIIFSMYRRGDPLMMLGLLWSGGLIFLVAKICDQDLKNSKNSNKKPRS